MPVKRIDKIQPSTVVTYREMEGADLSPVAAQPSSFRDFVNLVAAGTATEESAPPPPAQAAPADAPSAKKEK